MKIKTIIYSILKDINNDKIFFSTLYNGVGDYYSNDLINLLNSNQISKESFNAIKLNKENFIDKPMFNISTNNLINGNSFLDKFRFVIYTGASSIQIDSCTVVILVSPTIEVLSELDDNTFYNKYDDYIKMSTDEEVGNILDSIIQQIEYKDSHNINILFNKAIIGNEEYYNYEENKCIDESSRGLKFIKKIYSLYTHNK